MKTLFLLMAAHEGKPIIPIEKIRADYFGHLTMPLFKRKLASGEIKLPVVSMEDSQKSEKGIHLSDLANYIDSRHAKAKKELELMQ